MNSPGGTSDVPWSNDSVTSMDHTIPASRLRAIKTFPTIWKPHLYYRYSVHMVRYGDNWRKYPLLFLAHFMKHHVAECSNLVVPLGEATTDEGKRLCDICMDFLVRYLKTSAHIRTLHILDCIYTSVHSHLILISFTKWNQRCIFPSAALYKFQYVPEC